ncbi:YitT family protein [Bacillus ectoiniformans]|uniref:YitT family protein n=1 Tax=Bacillus ectoiniformans TaxID=1494429 RepID=UPI00195E8C88|nr:YitT family protein [Bacillus ectoiniformans]
MFFIEKMLAILFGSCLLSIGINLFLVPFDLLDGGIIGISLILYYLLGVKVGLTIIIVSLPIFLLAWFYSKSYFYNSLHGMLVSSFMIDILHPLTAWFTSAVHPSPLVSSILGGIFIGLGIGIMLRFETSTGGTDLLAQFLAKMYRINVGLIIFLIDFIVILAGGILLSADTLLLSTITIIFVGLSTGLCTANSKTS